MLKNIFSNKPESKTARFQMLLTPSLHKKAKATAKKQGISVNQLLNNALEKELGVYEAE